MNISNTIKNNVVLFAALSILGVTTAFTTIEKDNETFYYHGTSFDKNSVEDESNWLTTPRSAEDPLDCGIQEQITCEYSIAEGYEDPVSHQLNSALAKVIATPPSNPGDPTTVSDVQMVSNNQSLNPAQIKGAVPED